MHAWQLVLIIVGAALLLVIIVTGCHCRTRWKARAMRDAHSREFEDVRAISLQADASKEPRAAHAAQIASGSKRDPIARHLDESTLCKTPSPVTTPSSTVGSHPESGPSDAGANCSKPAPYRMLDNLASEPLQERTTPPSETEARYTLVYV